MAPSAQPTSPPPPSAVAPGNPAATPNKRDLKSWWKSFRLPKNQEQQGTTCLCHSPSELALGVPLPRDCVKWRESGLRLGFNLPTFSACIRLEAVEITGLLRHTIR